MLLMLSGALNIGLFVSIFYWFVKEKVLLPEPVLAQEVIKQARDFESDGVFSEQSFEDLLLSLGRSERLPSGYQEREVALAYLVGHHDFDLSRALLGLSQVEPNGQFGGLPIYSGLHEEQWKAIEAFAKSERWPISSVGLFQRLRLAEKPYDPSLMNAFFLTHEFLVVETLFNRCEYPLEKAKLLEIMRVGSWGWLEAFAQGLSISKGSLGLKRRQFLVHYAQLGAPVAAKALIVLDSEYLIKDVDSENLKVILKALPNKPSARVEEFLNRLLKAGTHSSLTGLVEKMLREVAPPSGEAFAAYVQEVPDLAVKPRRKRTYVVRQGDSLWKIAKRFNAEVAEIKRINELDSDLLQPGRELEIP